MKIGTIRKHKIMDKAHGITYCFLKDYFFPHASGLQWNICPQDTIFNSILSMYTRGNKTVNDILERKMSI